jgi:hypothetical protein
MGARRSISKTKNSRWALGTVVALRGRSVAEFAARGCAMSGFGRVLDFLATNTDTGEVHCMKVVKASERYVFGWDWICQSQPALLWLVDQKLTGSDLNVLLTIFARLDSGNAVTINQKEIAAVVGIKPPAVSKSLRKLIDKGVILQRSKEGSGRFVLSVNPTINWKGQISAHRGACSRLPSGTPKIHLKIPKSKSASPTTEVVEHTKHACYNHKAAT